MGVAHTARMGQPSDDSKIDEMARRGLGLVSRPALIASGFSDAAIKGHVASGRFVQVQHGVYRTFGTCTDWSQALLAACLAAGPATVASHRSAAHLWGLDSH
jgi:Transcriptional regulator, AbiEi antitoxin